MLFIIFFGSICFCSVSALFLFGFVSFRKFCSIVADLKFKFLACLLGMIFIETYESLYVLVVLNFHFFGC